MAHMQGLRRPEILIKIQIHEFTHMQGVEGPTLVRVSDLHETRDVTVVCGRFRQEVLDLRCTSASGNCLQLAASAFSVEIGIEWHKFGMQYPKHGHTSVRRGA